MVVAAAKVSTCGEEAVKFVDETANFGLINYLMKMRHGTPFEHSALTMFVHAPIFVFRELHRHRIGFSFNEFSARYSTLEPAFWIPRHDRKMKPVDGFKPSRPNFEDVDDETYNWLIEDMKAGYIDAYERYEKRLEKGIAKEVARAGLPVGIYSSCWVTVNPRSLMHFISLRTHEPEATYVSYPQAEIEEAARVAEQILKEGWPLTYKAYCQNGRVAP